MTSGRDKTVSTSHSPKPTNPDFISSPVTFYIISSFTFALRTKAPPTRLCGALLGPRALPLSLPLAAPGLPRAWGRLSPLAHRLPADEAGPLPLPAVGALYVALQVPGVVELAPADVAREGTCRGKNSVHMKVGVDSEPTFTGACSERLCVAWGPATWDRRQGWGGGGLAGLSP